MGWVHNLARGIIEIVEQEGMVGTLDNIRSCASEAEVHRLRARVAELEATLKNTDDALEDSKIVIEPMRVITQRQADWKNATLDKISKARNANRVLLSSPPSAPPADVTRALATSLREVLPFVEHEAALAIPKDYRRQLDDMLMRASAALALAEKQT